MADLSNAGPVLSHNRAAALFRFEAMAGVGHYPADQVPDHVNALLLEHIRKFAL